MTTKNDFFLTFNPIASFTPEIRTYLQSLCDSYICVREHESTNAHCHIVVIGITARDQKSIDNKIKKKYPELRGNNQLVIKIISSSGVYNYISKEYTDDNWPTFQNQLSVYNCEMPNQEYFQNLKQSYLLHQETKSLSGKFNLFWYNNKEKYEGGPNFYKLDFCILLAFKDFCIEFKVKDCTPRAFERYKFYLYLRIYPESYVELMSEKLLLNEGYQEYLINKKL